MEKAQNKSLFETISGPLVTLSVICFVALGITTYLVTRDIVQSSISSQAKSTLNIFTNSIRNDLINGLDKEVYRKCKSLLNDDQIDGVEVIGLESRRICSYSNLKSQKMMFLTGVIYFGEEKSSVAGSVSLAFKLDWAEKLLYSSAILLILSLFLLFLGYWLVSIYFVRRETRKFTKLASMLSENKMEELEHCKSSIGSGLSRELHVLCMGIQNLATNWLAYQKELITSERLKAVNEVSRILAHDIKSPLGALKTVSLNFNKDPEVLKGILDKSIAKIERLLIKIVKNEKAGAAEEAKQYVDLNWYFKKILSDLKDQYSVHENIEIEYELPVQQKLGKGYLSLDTIERAIANLVKNSFEAQKSKNCIVKIRVQRSEGELQIAVEDNGSGVSDDILEQLRNETIKSTKPKGSGLGLIQIKKTAEEHGGSFTIANNMNSGATAVIKVFL